MSIRNKAVIARLQISDWRARKYDAKATKDFHAQVGASDGSGRYNKVLIAQDALKEIHEVIGAARRHHEKYTCTWDKNAGGLLPVVDLTEFSKEFRKITTRFNKAVGVFCDHYQELVEGAKASLNGLFNPDDYPSVGNIRHRFAMRVQFEPVPDAGDFRVDISEAELNKIKKSFKADFVDRRKQIDEENFKRLEEVLVKVKAKLDDPKAIFRDSLIENLVEAVERIPNLNLTNNPNLKRVNTEAKKKLAGLEPQNLRSDDEARAKAAKDAEDILKKMAAYTG